LTATCFSHFCIPHFAYSPLFSCFLSRCIGALLLTGTPMKNGKPSNLFPLLRATRHPLGDDQKLYETFFCNGQTKCFGGKNVWDANGSSNLGLLNAHITSHVLYKTKEECLKELPGKKREYKTVPVGSKFEIQHNRALIDLVSDSYKTKRSVCVNRSCAKIRSSTTRQICIKQ